MEDESVYDRDVSFYCILKNEQASKLEIRFKQPAELGNIEMTKIDECIYYAEVKIPEECPEYRYSYVRQGQIMMHEQDTKVEQEANKKGKFMRLDSIFDFPDEIKVFNTKKKAITYLLKFFLSNFMKKDAHFGSPRIIKDLIQFLQEDNSKFHYSSLFKIILEEIKARPTDKDIYCYVLELFSYIKP